MTAIANRPDEEHPAASVVERYHQCWIARDVEGILALFHPEIEYFDFHNNRQIPRDDLRDYIQNALPDTETGQFAYTDRIRVDGDTAFVQYLARLPLKRGQYATLRVCEAITIADGLVRRVNEYASRIQTEDEHLGEPRLGLSGRSLELMMLELSQYFEKDRPFLDPDLDLTTVARVLGYTRNQVSYLLNRQIGQSFYQFLNHARLDEFCQRLRAGPEQPMNEHVFASGFNSVSVFYRAFRDRFGTTPKAWLAGTRDRDS
ncbi:AraC family transcriptional regulator [Rhizobium alvei]|uniref:Nuclear transport factor 2 family protein n=1 Tax=Rhizobium alvei TaxID=1132659 RepID=A0ABT8YU23_9HYPH|nr:nuclear transport factor 2 family protein [Rhizobium alvei]MDO6966833.1 nuclear transport factor 2 family protein [Rhizobium alvei]